MGKLGLELDVAIVVGLLWGWEGIKRTNLWQLGWAWKVGGVSQTRSLGRGEGASSRGCSESLHFTGGEPAWLERRVSSILGWELLEPWWEGRHPCRHAPQLRITGRLWPLLIPTGPSPAPVLSGRHRFPPISSPTLTRVCTWNLIWSIRYQPTWP